MCTVKNKKRVQSEKLIIHEPKRGIATLQQAASIANVKVDELINHLRKEVGQDLVSAGEEAGYITTQPSWFDAKKVIMELDASEMLERGEHPVNQVIADLKDLPAGSMYALKVPFLPAPLIDKASSLNFEHWVQQEDEHYKVWFFKP
ncbi:MAG: hypothetical protein EA361_12135 [Bacteroidetes bacterium]|nr:MAG: hypothetical protein EA361_12135 [Bacteroidota bacterium]